MTLFTIYEIYEVHTLLGRNLQYNLVIRKLVILICYIEYSYVKSGFYLLYLQTRKSSQTGLSQTQHAQPSSTDSSTQHSRSVNLPYGSHQVTTTTSQPVVSVDQPMEYHGQTYYPESVFKDFMQHKTTQEGDIYRLQRELKEKKKEVDELRSRY